MGASGPKQMEQRIRFREIDGRRIAYAEVGSGPPLVIPAPWVSNVHSEWDDPGYRGFIERLAETNTVIRYDRPGTGLSDRELPERMSLDYDVQVLEELLRHIDPGPVSMLGVSCGGCIALGFAARNPQLTTSLAFSGCYLDGSQLAPKPVQESLVGVIRASWGMGARMLSDLFVPGGSQEERAAWAQFQRDAADPEAAAELYELIYTYDAGRAVGHVTAPALVVHRRGDKAVRFDLGRELAASLANARLAPVEGERHLPWQGDSESVLAEIVEFLGAQDPPSPTAATAATAADSARPSPAPMTGPLNAPELSDREREVLRLVAEGLSDREIAERLVLSPHTVHRHVANIRTKLGQPSRAAAAAQATKLGLI